VKPRRVAFFSPGWPPESFANGIVGYVEHIRKGLETLGVQSRVLAFEGTGDILIPGSLARKGLVPRLAVAALWRLLPRHAQFAAMAADAIVALRDASARERIDLCEIEESFGVARWVKHLSPTPIVVRLHGPWFVNGPPRGARDDAAFRLRVKREGQAIAAADAVTSPSQDVLDRVREHYGLALADAQVIPNPGPEVDAASRWRADAARPGHILFVGRFDAIKGADLMLDAFARLEKERPQVHLTLAGPDEGVVDPRGKKWLFQDYVEAHLTPECRGKIDMLGRVDQSRVRELRQHASIVVSASRYDNFPMALVESLAQGCPTISSDSGGCKELIHNEHNGLLFDNGDATVLFHKLRLLVDRPEFAADLGARAIEGYRSRYLPEHVARTTLSFYEKVLDRFPKRSTPVLGTT
jgi:glycosyltransferase involved in cell wall biosynthesis